MWWAKRNVRRPSTDFIAVFFLWDGRFSASPPWSGGSPPGLGWRVPAQPHTKDYRLHRGQEQCGVTAAACVPAVTGCLPKRFTRVTASPNYPHTLRCYRLQGTAAATRKAGPRVIFICPIYNKHAETNIAPPASVIQDSVLQSFLTHPIFFSNHFPHDPCARFFIARRAMCRPPSGIQVFIRGVEWRPNTEARLVPSHNLDLCNLSDGCHCRGCGMQASVTRYGVMSC